MLVKGNTKKGEELLARAARYEGLFLDDVYGSHSAAKARAYRECRDKCTLNKGWDFHICSHNSQKFSVAWKFTNPETGEVMTQIETADYTYIVDGSRRA